MLIRRSCRASMQLCKDIKVNTVRVVLTNSHELPDVTPLYSSSFEPAEVTVCNGDEGTLGTVYLSLDKINKVSELTRRPVEMGIVYSTIHGVLNLLGYSYENQSKRARMTRIEASYMSQLGYPPVATA